MSCNCSKGSNSEEIKQVVKERYGKVAQNAANGNASCCCTDGTSKDAVTRDLYTEAETQGIPVNALLASMGCGNPTALAELRPGEIVLDLGSGGGIDVLISAKRVGPTGIAFGLDMTDEMLQLAEKNKAESGITNAEFLKGEIENIPLPDRSVDVIISNCVINLSTDKSRVLKEAFRVLKPGGRFAVADIALTKPLPPSAQEYLSLWAGCVAGALEINEYKAQLTLAGFTRHNIEVVRTYTAADVADVLPAEVIAEVGEAGVAELSETLVSAFIRAEKFGGCCCGDSCAVNR